MAVFPARAGMSPRPARPPGTGRSFPRASGDEPALDFLAVDLGGFSPRERG